MTKTQYKRTAVGLIFKMVFLKIPNVTVFAETVTFYQLICAPLDVYDSFTSESVNKSYLEPLATCGYL